MFSAENHPKFELQEEGQSRGTESPERVTGFFREDRLPSWSTTTFGLPETVLDYADLLSVTLHDENIQEFQTRWDEVLLSTSTIPSDDVLESLYKLRIREYDQLKTVFEVYEMEIHQKKSMPDF